MIGGVAMEKSKLQEILEMGEHEPRSYSGRAMYGRSCLGVECSDVGELFAEVLESADEDDLRELAETLRAVETRGHEWSVWEHSEGKYVSRAVVFEMDGSRSYDVKICR